MTGGMMRVRILGCGSNTGIPSAMGYWGLCNPNNPKNRRTRSSLYVEQGSTVLVIDAGPDFREQMLSGAIKKIDAVLYTHAHADHVAGLFELKFFKEHKKSHFMPIYGTEIVLAELQNLFPYAFKAGHNAAAHHYAFVAPHALPEQGHFSLGAFDVNTCQVPHGKSSVTAYRLNNLGYSTDLSAATEDFFQVFRGIDTWVVSCLALSPVTTHANLCQVLAWRERLKPRRTILTHMGQELDYDMLTAKLPAGVEVGYDGMEIMLPSS